MSFFAKEMEKRGGDVHRSSSGDDEFHVWQRLGPWELVLTDYRLIPCPDIKNGMEFGTAIDGSNPFQQMAIMTADPRAAREKLPQGFTAPAVLRKPFRIEQVLRRPCCHSDSDGASVGLVHSPSHAARCITGPGGVRSDELVLGSCFHCSCRCHSEHHDFDHPALVRGNIGKFGDSLGDYV